MNNKDLFDWLFDWILVAENNTSSHSKRVIRVVKSYSWESNTSSHIYSHKGVIRKVKFYSWESNTSSQILFTRE